MCVCVCVCVCACVLSSARFSVPHACTRVEGSSPVALARVGRFVAAAEGARGRGGSFHAAVAALLLSAHLADTGMCIVFLTLAFALFFVPGAGRFQMLKPWEMVMVLLGVLALSHKALDLWFMLPHTQAVAPIWSRTCLHQWLGIVPLTAFEERQLQLAFVLSMLMISAHIRAILRERHARISGATLLADVPREGAQRASLLASSPLLDEHEGAGDGAAPESPAAAAAGGGAVPRAPGGTLSAEHWRERETLCPGAGVVVSFGDGEEDGGSGEAAEDAWLGWTAAQATIGGALLVLFYLFAAVKTGDVAGGSGGGVSRQSKQSLAPVLMALLILHALVARSCIHAVCQRLQVGRPCPPSMCAAWFQGSGFRG